MIQAETLDLLEWQRLCQHLATFTATKLGAMIARQLTIPQEPAETLELLAQTQEAYQLEMQLVRGLPFEGIRDIGVSIERAEMQGVLSGEELLGIATTLYGARQLRRTIDAQEEITVLRRLVAELRTYPEIEQEIHRCIDERGDVTDRANPKLADIRTNLHQVRDRIQQTLQRILQRHAGAVQQSLITQRGDRFVIPVKAGQKDSVPGIVHDMSSTGSTLYIEPKATIELNNKLRQLQRQEQREEEIVLRMLSERVAEVKPDLEELLVICTRIDLAVARARYSLWLKANPPTFTNLKLSSATTSSDTVQTEANAAVPGEEIAEVMQRSVHPAQDGHITLRQLHHPLLVWQQYHEEGAAVVPIDVVVRPAIRVVAITGPNTGGKTVTLKTLGLAALMAKIGLFIPAKEPVELPWFEQVLADIGDEQSIEQSLSTFSGHIRRIVRILSAVEQDTDHNITDPNLTESNEPEIKPEIESETEPEIKPEIDQNTAPVTAPDTVQLLSERETLVLLDEVGAGTDPSEGSALATALLQQLAENTRLTMATTHFGELKALKYQDERFENASVEFDEASLQPTYRLLWGIPGRSNALIIARRLGLNDEILEQAASYVGGISQEVNEVIAGLEAQRQEQENRANAAEKLLRQTERLHQELTDRSDFLKAREQELKQAQEQAIQEALLQAKSEIAQVIRKLQQGKPKAQDAQTATQAIDQIADNYLPARQQPKAKPKPGFQPKAGDRIRIPSLGQTAEV
ncbi:MAG: endonuclease MutS2 [Microcoleaceae cyanobacterium]